MANRYVIHSSTKLLAGGELAGLGHACSHVMDSAKELVDHVVHSMSVLKPGEFVQIFVMCDDFDEEEDEGDDAVPTHDQRLADLMGLPAEGNA